MKMQNRNEETIFFQQEEGTPHLIVINAGEVQTVPLEEEQMLGRPARGSEPEIPVRSGVVSRRHGILLTNAAGCRYTDADSLNGTFCNGELLAAGVGRRLSDGDILRIHGREDTEGRLDVTLIYSTAALEGRGWNRVPLAEASEIVIGREEKLRLQGKSVSRRHASLFRAKSGWALIDHGSLNGVYLNAARIDEPVYLQRNDVIRIADYYFVFLGDELLCQTDSGQDGQQTTAQADHGSVPPALPDDEDGVREESGGDGLSVRIEERNVWQRAKKKTLLRDIRLEIPSGSMVLILGGSGAGKTTFMNAVMGYERAEGEIRYGGTDIYREYERMKYEIGYVPQQDLLRMNDTVYDTLFNAAGMRLPVMSKEAYAGHVEDTLHLLGLERLRDSLVGKLSGGQRKRLSIAVEYIGNPSLFFLDEPDSGLDGTMARQLMENLRTIADQGRIVLVISHSPDRAFELFDKVIVLAKSSEEEGRLVFYGSPDDACRFFEVRALEEIMRRINYPEEGGEGLADHYIRRFHDCADGISLAGR